VLALGQLALDAPLRRRMGEAARVHAQAFDWPRVLQRYVALANDLAELRPVAGTASARAWPAWADPHARFGHFSTHTLADDAHVMPAEDAVPRLPTLLGLQMANYGFQPQGLTSDHVQAMLVAAQAAASSGSGAAQVGTLVQRSGLPPALARRAVMWLWKFALVRVV